MITAIYIDDFQQKHYIVLQNASEFYFLKERFEEVYLL